MDLYEVRNKMKTEHISIYDLPLKVCYYARVSSNTDAQLNSIENQISYYADYIKQNPQWIFAGGYIDEGISGISTKHREQFNKMITDARTGAFDLVVTKEISRFARSTLDSIFYTQELLKNGVCVYFQNDNLNTIDPDSELRLTIMASIAQEEVRKLSDRIKFGHQRAIEKGVVLGNSQIYGYDKREGKLTINPEQAELVQKVFQLFTNGNSLKEIESILYKEGYRNTRGKRLLHSTLSNIIKNPKYKGYYAGNKYKIIDYRTKTRKDLPQDEWLIYKDDGNTVPQLVSEEMWEEANRILEERSSIVKSRRSSFKHNSVYTGKIICGVHSAPYWRSSYRSTKNELIHHWICSHKKTHKASACDSFAIYESEIDGIVKDVILSVIDNLDDYFNELVDLYKNVKTNIGRSAQLSALKKQSEKICQKKDRLLDLSLDGSISNSEFKIRNETFNAELVEINKKIREIHSETEDQQERINAIYAAKDWIKKNNNIERIVDKRLIERLLKKIIISPVGENEINMQVILNTGHSDDVIIGKNSRYSVQLFKKMIQQAENSLK